MQAEQDTTDVQAIKEIIARQFRSISWSPASAADWNAFLEDFSADASLYPAARPVRKQLPEAFVERMMGLARDRLETFGETLLGTEVTVFGNIAVAAAGCEIAENEQETSRAVEMLLLVKENERWKIVAQAWDTESSSKQMPPHLARRTPPEQ